MGYISRYNAFTRNNELKTLPIIDILEQNTDKFESYIVGVTRFDKLAFKYYGDATLGWLINYANPKYQMEFDFQDNDIIRIPFPLDSALEYYFIQTEKEINVLS